MAKERLKPTEVLSRAEAAFGEEDFERCTSLLDAIGDERALRLPPAARAKYHEMRGDIAAADDDHEAASVSYQALIAAERESGEPPVGLAFSYSRLSKALVKAEEFDRAHEAFGEAVRLLKEGDASKDDQISIWFGYGHALWEAERHQTAVSALEETFKLATEAQSEARVIATSAYFLASSWSHIVQLQQLAKKAAALFNEAAEAGVEKPEITGDLESAASDALESQRKGEAASVSAIEWLKRAGEKDFLLARAYKDYGDILEAGGKHAEAAAAIHEAIHHANDDDFSEGSHAGLREALGRSLAGAGKHEEAAAQFREGITIRESGNLPPRAELYRLLAVSLIQTGAEDEARHFEKLAADLEAEEAEGEDADADSDEDEESEQPTVQFPFDLSALEFDEEVMQLLDLDFDTGSFDYLEKYQLNTGTWWVCGFARNGIRDLYGFRLVPGLHLRECPVVCVPENSSEVQTYARTIADFLPMHILGTLYASWEEFKALSAEQWKFLVDLHCALGGAGELEQIRAFLEDDENRDTLTEGKNELAVALDRERASVPESDEPEDAEEDEDEGSAGKKRPPIFEAFALVPDSSPWKIRYAASLLSAAALGGHDPDKGLVHAAWMLSTNPAPVDLAGRGIDPGDILRGAYILVRQFQDDLKDRPGFEDIASAAGGAVDAGSDYDGVHHFHAALSLIGNGEYVLAFSALCTFAYFSAEKLGMAAPPALDAALALAKCAGWTDVSASLAYMQSIRETDDWPEGVMDACLKMEERVTKAFESSRQSKQS